jgi:hypothetical protein
MTRISHAVCAGLSLLNFTCLPASAAPDDPPVSSSSRSISSVSDAAKKVAYSFCDGPQNAQSYAASPVKVVLGQCSSMSQSFTATSDAPSAGHSCGGYAIAFGPKGKLNPNLHQITMTSAWGDAPLTAAECASAKVTAQAWGERCVNEACKKTTWDLIEGGPKQRDGKWDPARNACVVEVRFTSEGVKYRTLNLDTITTVVENGQIIRKRAKGTILAELKKDPPCYSGEATPAMPPAK